VSRASLGLFLHFELCLRLRHNSDTTRGIPSCVQNLFGEHHPVQLALVFCVYSNNIMSDMFKFEISSFNLFAVNCGPGFVRPTAASSCIQCTGNQIANPTQNECIDCPPGLEPSDSHSSCVSPGICVIWNSIFFMKVICNFCY
jgi:hypothetical protein